jgi:hypothetical protein
LLRLSIYISLRCYCYVYQYTCFLFVCFSLLHLAYMLLPLYQFATLSSKIVLRVHVHTLAFVDVWVYECVFVRVCVRVVSVWVYECVSLWVCVELYALWVRKCISMCVCVSVCISYECVCAWVCALALFLSFRTLVLWIYYYYHYYPQFTAGIYFSNSRVTNHAFHVTPLNIFWLHSKCKVLLLSALECIDQGGE